ncbi:Putative hydroxylase/desaturase AsaB [Septoria linicola]|uniref:Hydroxylase/desaturase AsaB n=1 Tax=Septoria linicola TaxID=215465 RepID=A0A9Q9B846_9PEZI|nr:Putative hydroxylase/desaturase AsaB [Septoria linicola]
MFRLDTHGFQYVNNSSVLTPEDTDSHGKIREVYYEECVELLKTITGASRVHVMGHVCRRQNWDKFLLRSDQESRRYGEDTNSNIGQGYTHYSYEGAKTRLDFNLPQEAEKLSRKRWAIINIWRPIYPVTRENLALADARSSRDDELRPVIAKCRRPDDAEKLSPITRAAYNRNDVETWSLAPPSTPDQHKWYYCSELNHSDALLLKIFDSSEEEGVARRTPRTAFTCSEDYGDQRQSIEVRSLVFWDD